MNLFKTYLSLTKPGIIFGNLITAAAGFFLASKGHVNLNLLLATLVGTSLGIASACVFNNFIDRDIDEKMTRTKNRALVKKLVPVPNALMFGVILGLLGFLILVFYVNFLTLAIGFIGAFFYLVLYSIWKRRSIYGTLFGAVSGATPIVTGYTAAANHFDLGAIILFMILFLWQMPHFYSIAIFRLKDYTAASLPVLPVVKGIYITKIHMLFYISAFIITASMITIFGYTGYIYLTVVILAGFTWLGLCIKGFKTNDDKRWARKMFGISLMVIITLSVAMSFNVV
jgi:protoheme IX farnesyltransferase